MLIAYPIVWVLLLPFRVVGIAVSGVFALLGAIIMFGVLGFLPGWIVAKTLNSAGMLHIPKEVELLGLDFASNQDQQAAANEIREAKKRLFRDGSAHAVKENTHVYDWN